MWWWNKEQYCYRIKRIIKYLSYFSGVNYHLTTENEVPANSDHIYPKYGVSKVFLINDSIFIYR